MQLKGPPTIKETPIDSQISPSGRFPVGKQTHHHLRQPIYGWRFPKMVVLQ